MKAVVEVAVNIVVEVVVVMDEEVVDTKVKRWLWMRKWWIWR